MSLSALELRRAASIQERIESLQQELARILGGSGDANSGSASPRRISKAGLGRISAAAKLRWARLRANAGAHTAPTRKRRMTAAGRARLSELARARWRKAKASGKSTL